MKRVSDDKKGKSIGILVPQVISLEEVKKLKDILKEISFRNAKIGIMIETPAAVQIIREICEEGIDFVSFGTNDLTQYTLAVDRGNEQVQSLYDDLHPSVLSQLAYVIKICKENNVETSICGQAGSKKEMVKFLVERGIDSISVNADTAGDMAEYIAGLEKRTAETAEPREMEEPGKGETKMVLEGHEKDLSKEMEIKKYAGLDDELPVIPGTEYTKIEENVEETLDIF
jgi:pyruvate,water dikinase